MEKQFNEVLSGTILSEIGAIDDSMLESTEFEILKTGEYYDARYGKFSITSSMLADLEKNFNAGVLGIDVAVDKNHEAKDGAMAWIKSVRVAGDKLLATLKDYSEEGRKALKEKIFKYFSVEFAPFDKVDEYGNKTTIANVLRGLALTNRPVIKGMRPTFYSESLSHNFFQKMDKVKQFAEKLSAQEKVSKEDVHMLKGMFAMLSEEEQVEAAPAVEEVETKVEEEPEAAATPAEVDPETAAKEAEQAELAEKTLSENKTLSEQNLALAEENKKMAEKLAEADLAEEFRSGLLLSETVSVGFEADAQSEVVGFMRTLSEDQRTAFKSVLKSVRNVDFKVAGAAAKASATVQLSEDSIVELAEKLLSEGKAKNIDEAQKMALAELTK